MAIADDRTKAMNFDYPEYIPVAVSVLPATWMKYREALDELVNRHPIIFGKHQEGDRDYDAVDGTYVMGEHTDAWGCGWEQCRARYGGNREASSRVNKTSDSYASSTES